MRRDLTDWSRPHFTTGGGDPSLFYVVYGNAPVDWSIPALDFRCAGVPNGIEVFAFDLDNHPEVVDRFRQGFVWDEFVRCAPNLAAGVLRQDECQIIKGQVSDPDNLNYLRDLVGLIEWLLTKGAMAVYDPYSMSWWPPDKWNSVFKSGTLSAHEHVVILDSSISGETWLHTRGMIKFGRPDLSVRGFPLGQLKLATEIINRFIEFQALGGVIKEGSPIRMASAPNNLVCRHAGSFDDPEFNNVHVEISWPKQRQAVQEI